MKRYPPKRILIPAVLVVPWIVFIHGCSRPDPAYTEARIITFQAENHVSGKRSHTASAGEPGPDRREISFRASVNNLIIPGRVTRSAEFIPGKNLNITVGGASLEIPPGGMKEHCAISVTGLLAEDLPPIPPEISTVTAGYYAGYRFLPHGKLFDSPATIALQYDKNLIPPGYSPDDIFTFWFDEDEKKWKALDRDTVDIDRGMIISATNHFTDMINGIITIPESPQTSGFVPTSVNDIRVAEPSAGITLIEPPV
ncbi:MAG TPA: hypothetical protein VK155_08830, partial [Bacteroidales bacterium]|nr:hypothetical protein [Bacteroidales bacterium]